MSMHTSHSACKQAEKKQTNKQERKEESKKSNKYIRQSELICTFISIKTAFILSDPT